MYYQTFDDGNWPIHLLIAFIWMLVIVVFIMVIVKLAKSRSDSVSSDKEHQLKPIDIAKTRYAKGEITKAEFEQIKKDLEA
jgi:putative membrane protein